MKTPRIGIEYPAENQRAWWDIFVNGMNQIDSALFANREDRNILMFGGGSVSWNAVSGELSWGSDIRLISPYKGYVGTISAGSITLSSGQFFYVNMVRLPSGNFSLTPIIGGKMPEGNNAFAIAFCYGTSIYFRNGRSLDNGESGPLFVETVPGSGIYDWIRMDIEKQLDGDTWLGYGATETASSQGGLTEPFPDPLIGSESVDVFKDGVLMKKVSGAPSDQTEWRWIDSGSPNPVIEIGFGGSAGDIYTVRYPRGLSGSLTNYLRVQAAIQSGGDTWIGNGDTDTASSQGGLGSGIPIVDPQAIDVYYEGSLIKRVSGAPADTSEWRWVESGSPAPVIEIGAGSTAGDLVIVRYPYV